MAWKKHPSSKPDEVNLRIKGYQRLLEPLYSELQWAHKQIHVLKKQKKALINKHHNWKQAQIKLGVKFIEGEKYEEQLG
jgi:hypothetical protein